MDNLRSYDIIEIHFYFLMSGMIEEGSPSSIFITAPYFIITVPVFPSIPSAAFSKEVMRALLPSLDSAKDIAALTLGSMDPGAK